MRIHYYAIQVLVLLFVIESNSTAQCIIVDPSHSYDENFETTNGGWTTGGDADDWTWGMPQKKIINTTVLQDKCWVTGGLTKDGYNAAQKSWVQSPCLDISQLQHPYIFFKVIWETAFGFDGATLQYSTDHGLSWENLGFKNDAPNCLNKNWFNTSNIQNLGFANNEGWSGNADEGNGFKDWVSVNHTLPYLKGVTNITFRFFFGSGYFHNDHDGFAFDNFFVGEAPKNNANFSYTCGASNTYQFKDNSLPCAENFLWDFDDVNSGVNNTSIINNPQHVFTTSGTHNVTLTVSGPDNAPATVTKSITGIKATITQPDEIKCYGNNTASAVVAVNPQGNYSYAWNTMPVQITAKASNLPAGDYSVEISGSNICTVTQNITIKQPSPLVVSETITNALCASSNGSAALQASGGISPYTYKWNNGVQTNTQTSLAAGLYNVQVTDANNCSLDTTVIIEKINPLVMSLGKDTGICNNQTLLLSPGNFTSYKWQDGSTAPDYPVTHAGTYFVSVTNADNCSVSDTINIYQDCGDIYFPTAFTPNGDGINDEFGATGNVSIISNYSLNIYNRWGNRVFTTSNPNNKWKGNKYGQHNSTETYTWLTSFTYKNQHYTRTGTITVIY